MTAAQQSNARAVRLLASTDGLDLEANLFELALVEDQAAVKDESGLVHAVVDRLPIELLEFVPVYTTLPVSDTKVIAEQWPRTTQLRQQRLLRLCTPPSPTCKP